VEDVWVFNRDRRVKDRKSSARENLYALALCLIILLIVILTADASPQWIYQGF